MLIRWLIFSIYLLLIGLNVSPTAAQTFVLCAERGDAIKSLEEHYSEKPFSRGLTGMGVVLELFISEDQTFTLLMTQPNGISCVVATGSNWEKLPVSRNTQYLPSF